MSQADEPPTFEYFANFLEIPYTVVTFVYIVALLVISAFVAGKRLADLCKCCEGCCSTLENSSPVVWATKFSGWLVRLVFGKSEGLSEEEAKVDIKTDKKGVPSVYVESKKLKSLEVNILGTIILCFSLIMGIAAFSVYMLEISHTCSNDPAIYCYPQLLDPETAALVSPNLTLEDLQQPLQQPVEDCSLWVNSTIGSLVTFQCFRFAYNGQLALATAGGLLALFVVAMRITVSVFLKVFGFFVTCRDGCCEKFVICLQVIAVMLLLMVDTALAVVVMAFQLHSNLGMIETEQDPVAQQVGRYIADNGLQALVILGTATLLLLIDWSDYARQIAQDKSENPESPKKRSKNLGKVEIVMEEKL